MPQECKFTFFFLWIIPYLLIGQTLKNDLWTVTQIDSSTANSELLDFPNIASFEGQFQILELITFNK